ncbi:cryptochrome-1 [Physcomitrium patens]|uniref:cryptochrome-1 n=1 Tax=Physcomitrium patens TaxID=3218 RepID=UPI000D16C1AF|nr:cryptochrome-1-like [Physcomitrium patens]|eukprot:XP_024380472.1 cryptochrome-1-like [Physcomitrella patens]
MGVREQVAGFVFAVATDRLCEGQAEGGWGIGDADVAAVASPAFWGAERAEDIPRGAEEADNVGSRGERGRGGEREHVSEGVRVSGVLAIFEFPLSVHAREVAAGEFEVVSVARGRGVLQGVEARADGVPVGGCGDEGAVGDGVGAQSDPRGGGEFLGEVSAAAVEWGMKYFWDVLLDADLECDVLGWQYISGSLPDGHELDRIENPEVEGYRFDPDGDYVRRWIPELARLPNEWVHHPWDAPPSALRAAGVELGTNYPRPIVEIGAARERLQASLAEMWERDAAMKAALANGLEEGLGETVEVAGTGGPEHERMDVPRVMVHMQRDADMSCNSSRRDQLVPEIVPNQFHIRAHESIMNRSAAMVEDGEEAGRAAVPMVFASVRRGMGGNYGGHHVEGNGGEVAQASAPIQWPTVTAVDYELDSTAESASVTGRGGSEGGTVPVWSQSVSARTPIQVREGLVPEVRRGPGLSRRQLQASVQRVNLEGMTSNKQAEEEDFYVPKLVKWTQPRKRRVKQDG